MTRENGRRRWAAGALRAGRAAAFLTLATGINGTVAALEPRYEPIYVYLVAVVVVAWLGSVLLGVTTAVVAVVLYDWMFGPSGGAITFSSVVPFVVAIGAAIVTRLARAPLQRPAFPTTPDRPLLDVPTLVSATPATDPRELQELRVRLSDLGREAEELRATAHNEARLRMEGAASARARLAAVQQELDVSRREAAERGRQVATLQARLDELAGSERGSAGRLVALQNEAKESRSRIEELETSLRETTQELDVAWRQVDEQKSRADAEQKRFRELEQKANDALQKMTADLAARYQQPLADAKKSLGETIARIALIEKEREEARRRESEARKSSEADRAAREELATQLSAATAERDSLAAKVDELTKRGKSHEVALRRAAAEIDELRTMVIAAREEAQRHGAAANSDLAGRLQASETRAAALEQTVSRLREDAEAATTRLEIERAERERVEREHDRKLQKIVNGLTADYEETIGQITVERETARAELRRLTATADGLKKKIADQEAALSRAAAEIEELRTAAARAGEESAEARSAALEETLAALRQEAESARSRLEIERAERERVERDHDARLQSIVTGLTADYEETIGQITVERETARAELRRLTSKSDGLQKKIADQEAALRRASAEIEELRGAATRAREEAADLTSDYEISLAEANGAREVALSESRELAARVADLQKRLDDQVAATSRAREDAFRDRNDRLTEYGAKLVQAELRAATLLQEVERFKAEVEDARSRLELERSERERAAADFDRRLDSIVKGIVDDHESAVGEAMVEKEAAKAEARALAKKLDAERARADEEKARREKLEAEWSARPLGDATVEKEAAKAELRTLTQELDAERARADEEKLKRERLEAEWSEKLNTIVGHLATDHEADLGKAIEEREAAKAEARDLAQKVKALQRQLGQATASTLAGQTARPASVLIVHRDAGTRAMTKHALEQAGYTVSTAADGLEGLRLAAAQRPDVVLAEAVLPKMNGRELVQLLKSRAETSRMKIVLISGSADAERGADFRADEVVESTTDFTALRAALAKVLAKV
jgi:plectin